jgi:hypothetical protein
MPPGAEIKPQCHTSTRVVRTADVEHGLGSATGQSRPAAGQCPAQSIRLLSQHFTNGVAFSGVPCCLSASPMRRKGGDNLSAHMLHDRHHRTVQMPDHAFSRMNKANVAHAKKSA